MAETLSATADAPAAAPQKRLRTDYHLWGTYLVIVMVAVIELFSASIQDVAAGNIFGPLVRHGSFLAVGLVCMLVMQHIHYRYIYGLIPLFVLACVGVMVAVDVAGSSVNEARRVLAIGDVKLLPADALKLAVALGIAWILTRTQVKGKHDVSTTGLVGCIVFMLVCAGLVFPHGLSNAILVLSIGFSMMLVGGMSWKKFFIALAVVGGLGAGAFYIKTHAPADPAVVERQARIAALNGEEQELTEGSGRGTVWNGRLSSHFRPNKHLEKFSHEHQQEQLSYIAQAHGGFFGVGVGRSREAARLPLAQCDYIYAIVIEEMGLFAGLFVLVAYMWLLGRAAKLTMRFKQTLPAVLVMGCAFTIVFQALYHMGIVSGVLPVSGQPLPLISKGGVSVLTTSLAFGIMLSVARHAVRTTDTKADAREEQALLPENAVSDNPAMIEE